MKILAKIKLTKITLIECLDADLDKIPLRVNVEEKQFSERKKLFPFFSKKRFMESSTGSTMEFRELQRWRYFDLYSISFHLLKIIFSY